MSTWFRVLFCCGLVLCPAVAWADDVPLGDAAFTSYMQQRVQLYSTAPISSPAPFKLTVTMPSGVSMTFGFQDIHDTCVQKPAQCGHIADAYVQYVAENIVSITNAAMQGQANSQNAGATGPVDATRLRVALRVIATCGSSQIRCEVVPSKAPNAFFFRRAFANLGAFCAMPVGNNGHAFMTNGERGSLNLSIGEAIELCEKNAHDAFGPLAGKIAAPPADGIGTIEEPGASARAIFAEDWAAVAKSFGGRLLIAVPARDTLLYIKGDGPDEVRTLEARAMELFGQSDAPLSNDVYRWDGSGWVLVIDDRPIPPFVYPDPVQQQQ
jgi:hypothetical protein